MATVCVFMLLLAPSAGTSLLLQDPPPAADGSGPAFRLVTSAHRSTSSQLWTGYGISSLSGAIQKYVNYNYIFLI